MAQLPSLAPRGRELIAVFDYDVVRPFPAFENIDFFFVVDIELLDKLQSHERVKETRNINASENVFKPPPTNNSLLVLKRSN
jgi:hypothetical protein